MTWPLVIPAAAIDCRTPPSRCSRSAGSGDGITALTRLLAPSSSRCPVGRPSASQTIREPESKRRGPSMPARRSASLLTSAECPSNRVTYVGRPPTASSIWAAVIGWSPNTFGSSPQPKTQPSGSACCADSCNAARTAARSAQPDRSTPSVIRRPRTGCMCPSTSPGVSTALPRSRTSVCAPRRSATSDRSPTATMRPSAMARADAIGRSGSRVWMAAAVITRSADRVIRQSSSSASSVRRLGGSVRQRAARRRRPGWWPTGSRRSRRTPEPR